MRKARRPPARLKLVAREEGAPLLRFVVERGGVSEEAARAAIERGGAFLRGRRERDPGAAVRKGDAVEVDLRQTAQAALGKERILHLDEEVLAVDKPAGLSAQEDRAGGPSLPDLCSELLGGQPLLLVHRLDRGTTGVTVLARTRKAQAALLEEFREHRARKEYRALVAGGPPGEEGLIETPVGAPATTRFRVLERYAGAALIAAMPETGRTHQIRIHLRELGCPLLGDARYGGPLFLTRPDGRRIDFSRPMLHAFSLEVRGLRLRAPLPADFEAARAFLQA